MNISHLSIGEGRLAGGSLYSELLHSISVASLLTAHDPRTRDHYERAILQGGEVAQEEVVA